MATQGIIPFPCRKPRSLASKLNSTSPYKSPKNQENVRRTLMSISNIQNGNNPCIRSIMPQPRSPRKRLGDSTNTTEGWTNDDFLNELFKLSPCSPVKQRKEIVDKTQHTSKTPTKSVSRSCDFQSPTRAILSPIRALSLNSPCRKTQINDKNVKSKTAKVLQLKLARIEAPGDDQKLAPDETPTKPTRNRKTVSISEKKSRKAKIDNTYATSTVSIRRVTRSAKKIHKLKLFEEDDFKENEDPNELSPSPKKRQKPASESSKYQRVCRNLLPPSPEKQKAKRALSPVPLSPKKLTEQIVAKAVSPKTSRSLENALETPPKLASPSRSRRMLEMHRPDGLIYQHTKRALHSSVPDVLVGREDEIQKISQFISYGVTNQKSGSLYISGAPGTGKSACLMKVLNNDKITNASAKKSVVISINCMSMRNSTAIYTKIATELGAKSSKCKTVRSAMKYLETVLTSDGPSVILLLDEMDQLDSKNQEVLYTIFEWPALENSRLLLIGIANALDLTDRILPRLQSRSKCKPTLINFQPYSKDQIVAILEGRIKQTMAENCNERVIDAMAVQFCARKVSAVAGDARKALDVCRRAVEVVETSVKSQHVLSPSGKENCVNPVTKKVGLQQIAGVLSGVYESSIAHKAKTNDEENEEEAFPLQQKLAICTLILLSRHIKCKEVTMGKLHEAYTKICKKRQVTAVAQSEFTSILQLIETRGILSIKQNKQARMTKISLSLQEKDVEYALQDKTLLTTILLEGLPK
uniref:cell division control protein 6 homolog n=1 Tax=Styela clava TaxID=7725 RepID=UPI00193A47AC|nr:cell division control protein 6 homolog [Styela clava]